MSFWKKLRIALVTALLVAGTAYGTIESVTYISDLDNTYPANTDAKSEGDDHIRNIKTGLLNTFPNITGAVTPTHTELNYVDGVTSAIQTQLNNRYSVGGTDVPLTDGGTGASTAADARTNLGLGSIATQAASSVSITGGSITGITDLALADGGTGASTAADARTNLGLGSIATQAASSVSITGGSVTGITDLAIADGGTGASTAATALDNLGIDGSSGNVAFGDLGSDIYNHATLLTSGSTTSGNTTSLTGIASGYRTLIFVGYGYYSNDNGHIWHFRFGDGGYETSYTTLSIDSISTVSAADTAMIAPDTATEAEWSTSNDSSTNTFEFELVIELNGATNYKPYRARAWMRNVVTTTLVELRGIVTQTGEIDQVQLRCGTNGTATILGGNYKLYGIK